MKHVHLLTAMLLCWLTSPHLFAQAQIQPSIKPGDHIAIAGNTFADQLRIHGYLETLLLQHTIDNPVSIRNLGWAGDMLSARDRPTGFPTEEATLIAHKTDVIIACFGMGESFAGDKGIDEFKGQVKTFIAAHADKKYNGDSSVRLILVSPIACEDLGKLTPAHNKRIRDLEAYTEAMREVATASNISFVDLFEASRYLMAEPTGPNLTGNGIHLNPYGYWAISHTFYEQLVSGNQTPTSQSWQLRIDATARTSDARGVEISDIAADESGLTFQVSEKSAPSARPPIEQLRDQTLPAQLAVVRDTLVVRNLKPGKYRLTIDEKPVVTATTDEWATGVAIDNSPAHKTADAYRDLVNDKNLQFTYSWKALNQVHIVGERRSSPSGKELPKEVIEFNRLANERDAALRKGIELKKRRWRVERIER